jgi:hypothetical protein
MRIKEFLNISGYRIKEFFLYTICGIEFYRNYSRFYWGNIYKAINYSVCKYARCQKFLTSEQIKAMNGEKICNDCLQARIKFQKQNIYEKKSN